MTFIFLISLMHKALLLALLALLLSAPAQAQRFPVDTLIKTGPLTNRINLVFVGDGYQASEMSRYIADVNRAVSQLFSEAPYRQYRAYFNVFAIRVPSAQSGTSHPHTATDCGTSTLPTGTVNTYFRTTFDNAGIHRAVVTNGQAALGAVLAASFPRYSRAIVMVNTSEYGGTGGNSITMSANATAPQTLLHELGHTFAYLADEYWPGPAYAVEKANLTQAVAPVRWQSWVGQNGIGIYSHQESPTWKRPHQNCKMRYLGVPYCSVCLETLIESIHAATRPVDTFTPTSQSLTSPTADQTFTITPLAPTPNTLRVKWRLDGTVLAPNVLQVTIARARLATGSHTVEAEVLDTTLLTHNIPHRTLHRFVTYWDVDQAVTGTRINAGTADYTLETYPNPVTEALTVAYTLPRPGEVRMTVVDAAGRHLKTLTRGQQAAGAYTYELRTEELGLRTAGIYTLVLDIDGRTMSQRIVKE